VGSVNLLAAAAMAAYLWYTIRGADRFSRIWHEE
jgi:hypothetical protein